MGEGLLGPTLIHYGTPAQQARFLPPIREGARAVVPGLLRARRRQRPGQRQDPGGPRRRRVGGHRPEGLDVAGPPGGLVLRGVPDRARLGAAQGPVLSAVPMDQPGVEVRPITQLTRTSEFNEVFFDGARTRVDNVVGGVGEGWRVALGHPGLRARRGPARPPARLPARARPDRRPGPGRTDGRATRCVRQQLAQAHIELTIMRYNTLRSLVRRRRAGGPARGLHRQAVLGELAPPAGRAGHGRPGTGGDRPRRRAAARERRLRAGRVPALLSCSPGRRPSTVAPTRSSATSSASGSWACRPSPKGVA